MKIACIGWGSLIWKQGSLDVLKPWFNDGPLLPIEFTRISNDNRVTLIIDREAKPIQSLWAIMKSDNINDAKQSLAIREGVTKRSLIHSVSNNDDSKEPIHSIIIEWLKAKGLDYAIWKGLSFSKKSKNARPSIETIISHLKDLDLHDQIKAKEYISRAPHQINTDYRRAIIKELNW